MNVLLPLLAAAGAIFFVGTRRSQTVIDKSISVNASPEETFRYLDEEELIPRYAPGVKSVEVERRTEQRIGDSFKVNYSVLGLNMPTRFVVTQYDKNSRALSSMEGPMSGTFDWTLSERANGTDVSVRIEYGVRGGALGRGLDGLLLRRVNEANVQRMLQNFKALVEGRE